MWEIDGTERKKLDMRTSEPICSIVKSFLVISAILMTGCGVSSVDGQAPTETSPADTGVSGSTATSTVTPSPTMTPALEPLPVIASTFEDGGRNLIFQSSDVTVVFDKYWGGVIREVWLDGENMVNNYDGGRLLGVSFYDGSTTEGSTGHPNDTGWNPTPSDMFDNVNEPLEYSYSDNEFYLKTRYIQWFPLDKGGGRNNPVETDVVVETWAKFLGDPRLIQLTYRFTHEGDDHHLVASQELPFAYVRSPFKRFIAYAGSAPWTNDAVFIDEGSPVAPNRGGTRATEYWGGYPAFTYNYFDNLPPVENSCFYLLPLASMELSPGLSKEVNVFLYIGEWQDARARFASLHERHQFADIMDGQGFMDSIAAGANLSGVVDVAGWALDDRGIEKVEVLVDGHIVGTARYGHARPDVARANPIISNGNNFGYIYSLDTRRFPNGIHTLEVLITDTSGNTSIAAPGAMEVRFDN
jgi:hypothetical protein